MADSSKDDNVHLHLKTNSLRNNTLECDSLGLYYQVSTDTSGIHTTRLTKISKWIPSSNDSMLLAEWKRKFYSNGEVRLHGGLASGSSSPDFVDLKKFLPRHNIPTLFTGSEFFDRTFVANNGKTYTWKPRTKYMKLYCDELDKEIAVYHRPHYLLDKRSGSLELISDWKDILDHIVVTFVIFEKLHREEERDLSVGVVDS